jgi:hypothetical protein
MPRQEQLFVVPLCMIPNMNTACYCSQSPSLTCRSIANARLIGSVLHWNTIVMENVVVNTIVRTICNHGAMEIDAAAISTSEVRSLNTHARGAVLLPAGNTRINPWSFSRHSVRDGQRGEASTKIHRSDRTSICDRCGHVDDAEDHSYGSVVSRTYISIIAQIPLIGTRRTNQHVVDPMSS